MRPDVAAAREAWRAEVCGGIDPARLVFLDESGVDTSMTPLYARAPKGQRAVGSAPGGHWKRLTILGAIALNGLVATMTVAAATTTEVFLAFVQQVLLPALQNRPDSIVAMDNLRPHKAACVRQAFEAAGVAYRYLPPTARISTRSNQPGLRLRAICAKPKPAASLNSTPPCRTHWSRSHPATPKDGSA